MTDSLVKNTLVPLLLRLGLAAIFLFHGLEKVSGEGNEGGLNWARGMEAPPAKPAQFAVAWGELLGGIAMALGFLTRFAALGIGVIMVGAIVTVTGAKGFSLLKGGFEYNFAILVMCASLILLGGGTLSVDRLVRRKK
jgi:putative oxidoreductase